MGIFRRARDLPRSVLSLDNLILLLIGLGLLWFIGVSNPQRYIGPIRSGASCLSMPEPAEGNTRSLLALHGRDSQKLELGIRVTEEIGPGDTLEVDVLFRNEDIGPLILYFSEGTDVVTLQGPYNVGATRPNIDGVYLEFQEITTQQIWYAVPAIQQAPSTFERDDLYLLTSNSQCYVRLEFSFSTLQQNLFQYGEYSVEAYYFNDQRGVVQPTVNVAPGQPGAIPTPTLAFTDQGVWVNNQPVNSDDMRFSVLRTSPTAIAPPQ